MNKRVKETKGSVSETGEVAAAASFLVQQTGSYLLLSF